MSEQRRDEQELDKPPDSPLAPLQSGSSPGERTLAVLLSPGVLRAIRDKLRRTIQGHVVRMGREVESLFGALIGFIVGCGAVAVVAPSSSPLVGFLLLMCTVVGGMLGGRTSLGKGPLTSEEELQAERAEHLYNRAREALAARAKELREAGYSGRKIEAELGPAKRQVLQAYLESLDRLKDGRALLEREGVRGALGAGDGGRSALAPGDTVPPAGEHPGER